MRGSRNEKVCSLRLPLRRRQQGTGFLCAASMPLVAGAVFLGRPRERMILLKRAGMHTGMQPPQNKMFLMSLEKISLLLHHQQET